MPGNQQKVGHVGGASMYVLWSMHVSEFETRLDMNPRLPDKELLNIVDALNEIGNLPIEVLKSLKLDWTKWVSRRSILYV